MKIGFMWFVELKPSDQIPLPVTLHNEILGCRFIVSHERPFNTEKNAIYRFSMSLFIPGL